MSRLLQLLKGNYARALATVISGNTVAQVLPILILPLLTRLYELDSFGQYSVWLGFASIAGACLSGRMENAVAAEPDSEARYRIVWAVSMVSAWVAILAAVIAGSVLPFFDSGSSGNVGLAAWVVAPIVGLFMSLTMVRQQLGLSFQMFREVAILRIITAGSTVLLQVAFALLGWRSGGALISGYALGALIGIVATGRAIPLLAGTLRETASPRALRSFLSRYRDYYRYSAPAALIIVVAGHLPLITVGLRFGPEPAALVSIVYRAILSPTILIRGALSEIYRQRAGLLFGTTGAFRQEFLRTISIGAVLAALPIALVAIGGPDLFGFLFGEKWRPASEYAWLLLPLLAVSTVTAPVAVTLMIANRNLVDLWIQVTLLVSTAAALLLAPSARYALLAFSISYAAVLCIQLFLGFLASGGAASRTPRT